MESYKDNAVWMASARLNMELKYVKPFCQILYVKFSNKPQISLMLYLLKDSQICLNIIDVR